MDIRETLQAASAAIQAADKRISELEAENAEKDRVVRLACEKAEELRVIVASYYHGGYRNGGEAMEEISLALTFAFTTQMDTARRKFVPETLREKIEHDAWGEPA